jgi:hypothetical protein
MKTKLGVSIGTMICLLFLAGSVGFCDDEVKVGLKDWTAILESKVAEPMGARASSTMKISTSRSWPSPPRQRDISGSPKLAPSVSAPPRWWP